jgi:hypothetical protein
MTFPALPPMAGPPRKAGHRADLLLPAPSRSPRAVLSVLATLALVGCSGGATAWQSQPVAQDASSPAPMTATTAVVARSVEVHRSPGCGCCHEWEDYLAAHGFAVSAADDPDIVAFKARHGVPPMAQSCHTALIDDYVVEGHVPVAAIEDLLSRRPAIDGIALPGMPAGSPGMDGELEGPLEVLALSGGRVSPFGSYLP